MTCRTNAWLNLVLCLCHTCPQRRQWECEGQLAEVRAGKRGVCCSNALQRSAALERHNITFIPQSWRMQASPAWPAHTAAPPAQHMLPTCILLAAACTAAFLTARREFSSSQLTFALLLSDSNHLRYLLTLMPLQTCTTFFLLWNIKEDILRNIFCLHNWSQYLLLCSTEDKKSYRFGKAWGWVNGDRLFIFGWTVSLNASCAPLILLRWNRRQTDLM